MGQVTETGGTATMVRDSEEPRRSTRSVTTILLVEDDLAVRIVVRNVLEAAGYEVVETASCAAAKRGLESMRPDAAILDYQLPDGNALDLLEQVREADSRIPVIILTAHGSVELAVQAMRQGADHFFTKPVEPEALREILARCLEGRRAQRRKHGYDVNRNRHQLDPFLGTSAAVRGLAKQARKVAAADRPVLLEGETGCGKGVLALWLHDHSQRGEEPFVNLNCAGLKPDFLESELFGHVKGAFTGAADAKPGLLDAADRGTLFLDEIGDMDLAIQAKLLKVLEEQTFRRLGEVRERRVDVRLIAATHHDLSQMARQGGFRSDLYFRLNTLKLEIPPLRRRHEDVPALAGHFLERLGREVARPGLALSPDALEALVGYRWPGNIRELRNVLERAVLLGEGDVLRGGDFHFEVAAGVPDNSDVLQLSLEELEKLHIERVLEREEGSVSRAARKLGIQRNTLYQKIKKYKIERPGR